MIRINSLSFSYNNTQVLNDISLIFKEGQTTALLGHNGAGKTTLFKCILGILKPNSGSVEITVGNRNICKKIRISFMPELGGFYPLLSPLENLMFRASIYNSKIESRESALYWLDKLEINQSGVKLSGKLSQGMQKRLSIACTLINEPDILLLDEPTNGLDPESKDIVTGLIKEVDREDTTLVISTHDMNLVSDSCEKIIFLQNGSLINEEYVNCIDGNIKNYYLETLKNKG